MFSFTFIYPACLVFVLVLLAVWSWRRKKQLEKLQEGQENHPMYTVVVLTSYMTLVGIVMLATFGVYIWWLNGFMLVSN
jgi:hypothetical protein